LIPLVSIIMMGVALAIVVQPLRATAELMVR